MIMPGNNLSGICHYFAGKYPGKIGMLNTPNSWKNPPFYMPYALDNGCWIGFDEDKFLNMLKRASLHHKPMWVVVPDVIGDAEATMINWNEWHHRIDFPLAFACQDGMEPQDVPREAVCCFIGGTTDWKLGNAHKFKGISRLLHVGRVSTLKRLNWAISIGVDSIDGSGFFRDKNGKQKQAFIEYFEGRKQACMF